MDTNLKKMKEREVVEYNLCPSARPSVHPSISLSVRLSICLSVRLSICLSVRPSVRLSVRPSVRRAYTYVVHGTDHQIIIVMTS